jgi:cytochrome c oxidase assembly protein subunit 15
LVRLALSGETPLYKKIILFTTVFTFAVVVVGAFVRLTDAGLGCPDWPGCYGKATPAHAAGDIAKAVEEQGGTHGPVSIQKAWHEMFHRYLAGTLGLLILGIAAMAWVQRRRLAQSPWLPTTLLALVIFQAALGMWTVTLLLKPVIVTLHLLGGMATLALLAWLSLRQMRLAAPAPAMRLRPWAALGLLLLVAQIALGGWVSTNYAALACIDLPTCHGEWIPAMDFRHGFQLLRELGQTAAGDKLSYDALTAIHWTHRVGAVVVTAYLAWLAWRTARFNGLLRAIALVIGALLIVQVSLGVGNILTGLKLAVAVAHNAGAALLLVALVVLNFALSPMSHRPEP